MNLRGTENDSGFLWPLFLSFPLFLSLGTIFMPNQTSLHQVFVTLVRHSNSIPAICANKIKNGVGIQGTIMLWEG